jgi:hypothetical protein
MSGRGMPARKGPRWREATALRILEVAVYEQLVLFGDVVEQLVLPLGAVAVAVLAGRVRAVRRPAAVVAQVSAGPVSVRCRGRWHLWCGCRAGQFGRFPCGCACHTGQVTDADRVSTGS